MSEDFKYSTFASGDADFYDSVAIPFAESVEIVLTDENRIIATDLSKFLGEIDSRPKAFDVLTGCALGISFFVVQHFAGKILSDIYEIKIQPLIRRMLSDSDQKLGGANSLKPKMFHLGVGYEEIGVFVLVVVVDDTFLKIQNSENALLVTHQNAMGWIQRSDSEAPVHLYIINRSKVPTTPLYFDSFDSAQSYLSDYDVE